ncbi:MAG TPA: hypothetical protein VFA52_03230 [Candidatus Paceibacterota bacterium]|nr:hypothetical protein [Candidatus Paceibacterota bacterium]
MKTIAVIGARPPEINLTWNNALIIFASLCLLAYGLRRTVPSFMSVEVILKKNWALLLMLGIYAVVMAFDYRSGGTLTSLKATVRYGAAFAPLMFLLCLVMGIGSVVIVWHQEAIVSWMVRHHFIGSVGASLSTPTSNAMIPAIESCWKIEGLRPSCLFFMQASALMSIPLFMLRATGFRPESELPIRMWLTGVILSVVAWIFKNQIYAAVELMVPWFQLAGGIWDHFWQSFCTRCGFK